MTILTSLFARSSFCIFQYYVHFLPIIQRWTDSRQVLAEEFCVRFRDRIGVAGQMPLFRTNYTISTTVYSHPSVPSKGGRNSGRNFGRPRSLTWWLRRVSRTRLFLKSCCRSRMCSTFGSGLRKVTCCAKATEANSVGRTRRIRQPLNF